MEDQSFFIGVIGNIISVFLFLSPINTFDRIVKNKSTEEFNSMPYVSALLSTSLWTYYGIIKPGALLVATVNGFGAVMELIYVTLFFIFAPPRMKVKTAKLAALLDMGFLGAVIWSSMFMESDTRIRTIGIIGAVVNVFMYGSPLAALKLVIESRSVEYMPFLLSFCSFLNGGVWALYAVLVKDIYLLVPNAIGFILATIQLMVYARYRKQGSELQLLNEPLV
ncbi:Bidirectional sugar transporter SWEET17 [Bienertia sinuspersici]